MAKIIKIEEKLDQLAKVREVQKDYNKETQALIYEALSRCPDLKSRNDEVQDVLRFTAKQEVDLTEEIKVVVVKSGESIKGLKLQAIFTKGRTTWDAGALEGYAVAHPEINALKKVGDPSVSIREVKEMKEE
jgi:hypothetical protein